MAENVMMEEPRETKETKETKEEQFLVDLGFPKKPIETILEEAKELDPNKIAQEVLEWLDKNVEMFIDNFMKSFKISPNFDGVEDPPEHTKKLEDLFRAIPDDEVAVSLEDRQKLVDGEISFADIDVDDEEFQKIYACREVLNKITEEAHEIIKTSKEGLDKLYERMIFYYELQGFSNGKPLIQEFEGLVDISKFEYEAFSVGVKILEGRDDINEERRDAPAEPIKEYVIPEGFTIWLEIAFKPKSKPQSMF